MRDEFGGICQFWTVPLDARYLRPRTSNSPCSLSLASEAATFVNFFVHGVVSKPSEAVSPISTPLVRFSWHQSREGFYASPWERPSAVRDNARRFLETWSCSFTFSIASLSAEYVDSLLFGLKPCILRLAALHGPRLPTASRRSSPPPHALLRLFECFCPRPQKYVSLKFCL